MEEWRRDISRRGADRRTFQLPTDRSRPRIRPQLRGAPKRVASRFYQLLSGHAMIAPFLNDRWGWVDSSRCWWCNKGRQSREHLFKECNTWKNEIRELWTEVGRLSGKREEEDRPFKSRKGFGYRVQQARARPSNTTIRELLSDDRYTEAVLGFLDRTRVGEIGGGAVISKSR